jgi:hypothetical protein
MVRTFTIDSDNAALSIDTYFEKDILLLKFFENTFEPV